MNQTIRKDKNNLLFWAVLSVIIVGLPVIGFVLRGVNIISPYPSILFGLVVVAVCVLIGSRHTWSCTELAFQKAFP